MNWKVPVEAVELQKQVLNQSLANEIVIMQALRQLIPEHAPLAADLSLHIGRTIKCLTKINAGEKPSE
jgi:hypothetical protein